MSLHRSSFADRASQKGAALAVIMIMLLIMMLLGLAILRSTMLEERMSANMYDRSIAFESAERALREAEDTVGTAVKSGNRIGKDCSVPTTTCPTVPADTYSGGGVTCTGGTNGCWVNAATGSSRMPAAGISQYYVEFMGRRTSVDEMGDVNGNPYEPGSAPQATAAFYRVTARSHDPSKTSDRAVVVLQSTLMSY